MSDGRADVAIIGGGIAGLTAAYRLASEGVRFRLFEAVHRLGGLIRTEQHDGFLIDAGPDTLLAHRPEAIALCRELGLGDRLQPASHTPRPTSVVHNGHLHPLPEGMTLGLPARLMPFVRTRLFTPMGKARMAMDLAIRPRQDATDESIASFFRRRLGQEALERLGEPLLAGIHAGDAERLSVSSTFPQLTEMEARYGSVIRAAWAAGREALQARSNIFFSLPGGLRELVDSLVLRLPPASLRIGSRVTSIRSRPGSFELEADGQRLTTDAVIFAAPLWETARLLVPAAPDAAVSLAPVRFASSATIFLAYRRDQFSCPPEGHGFVVPRGEGLRMRACTIASNKYSGRAPEGCVLLKGYVGGLSGAETLGGADDMLTEAFEGEIRNILGVRGHSIFSRVYRWPGATPQMEVGHKRRIDALNRALSRHPGLVVIGAGVRGSGVPNSVADGTQAAAQVLSRLSTEAVAH